MTDDAQPQKVNPHKGDAVTADTVREKMQLIVWKPDDAASRRTLRVCSLPYMDGGDKDSMMIVVDFGLGPVSVSTSTIGLSADCDTGDWSHIAIEDDTEDS